MMQVTAVKVAVDNLPGIGAEEAIFCAKALIIDLFKGLEVVLNTLIVLLIFRFPGAVYF
jgi:hypothetical protein